jgi:hypothetical protein
MKVSSSGPVNSSLDGELNRESVTNELPLLTWSVTLPKSTLETGRNSLNVWLALRLMVLVIGGERGGRITV